MILNKSKIKANVNKRKSIAYLGNSGSNHPLYDELYNNILRLEDDLLKLKRQVTDFLSGAKGIHSK